MEQIYRIVCDINTKERESMGPWTLSETSTGIFTIKKAYVVFEELIDDEYEMNRKTIE